MGNYSDLPGAGSAGCGLYLKLARGLNPLGNVIAFEELKMSTLSAPPLESKPEVKQEGSQLISRGARARPLFDPEIVKRATKESFVKLDPRKVAKNPVMFVVEVGAALTTIYVIKDAVTGSGNLLFGVQIT